MLLEEMEKNMNDLQEAQMLAATEPSSKNGKYNLSTFTLDHAGIQTRIRQMEGQGFVERSGLAPTESI